MADIDIASILGRLDRLEAQVFGQKPKPSGSKNKLQEKQAPNGYAGPAGGVRLLVERGYFSSKRTLADVRGALVGEGYHYKDSAIQTALGRVSGKDGSLVSMKEAGKKIYARRK